MFLFSFLSPVTARRSRTADSLRPFALRCLALAMLVCAAAGLPLRAQTGGEAGIAGSVTDATGAAVPHATVTVRNDATGITTTRETTGSGLFNISPILPGTYTVSVKAPGFKEFVQKNLVANALQLTPLNPSLSLGAENTTVEVDAAPPALETTNASIGLTIENETYSNLPLVTNAAMRDATAFASLAPGTQGGSRLPVVGGTGNYLGQLYLDGLPAETINQQADNRVVSQAVSVDAVDQFQEVTSTPSVEYSGAGATNVTMKSGGMKYHGSVADFIRNTAFDLNGFANKATIVTNAAGQKVFANKPVDHQNELSATFGGHVPGTHRLFFFVAYDRFHNRSTTNPASFTIPTAQMRGGDFTQLNCLRILKSDGTADAAAQAACISAGGPTGTLATVPNGSATIAIPAVLYNPTTTSCAGNSCSRQPFQALKGGVLTNNIIPSNYISPIAQYAQKFLPDPTNNVSLVNNYTATLDNGFDNHATDWRVDFDLNGKQRISTVGAMGAVNYLNNYGTPYLPQPYTGGTLAAIFPKVFDVEHSYTISNSLVNQLKFGYVRFFMNIKDSTDGIPQFSPGALGITNLPGGQAGREFPGMSFGSTSYFSNAIQTFTGNGAAVSTQLTTPNNYTLVDNLQYVRGRHSFLVGFALQFQQINNANPATETGFLSLPFSANSTANFSGATLNTGTATTTNSAGAVTLGTGSGYSYASFLLGAVGNTSLSLQPVSETGGRYRTFAPYIQDTWKATNKLTLDVGLRWDYLPPFLEVKDRWSFLNPSLTNAATGTPGALQFAGNYGGAGVSCQCRTPVKTAWNNYGPRVGVTYAFTPTTVFRAGIGHVFSQGGGVGGRVGAANGTGAIGFNTTATSPAEVTSGANAGPSYYLNNSAYFTSIGKANTSLFGPGYSYPTAPVPSPASQILNTGNYLNSAGAFVSPAGVNYADPYFSGRAPDFTFYNVGLQQALTGTLTLGLNYVGNQSHHLYNSTAGGGNIRGYWANQLNPTYLAAFAGATNATCDPTNVKTCSPLLSSQATPANIAKAQSLFPGVNFPAFYAAAAAVNGSLTVAQGLVAFPQYSGVTDTWGVNTANFSYNSMQVSLDQRNFRGLTLNVNYTWSKNVGDDGVFRSGFDIPANAISGGTRSYHMDRIERGDTTISQRHVVHAFGVYKLPFGTGQLGGQNVVTRQFFGGWLLGGIFTYGSGTPIQITSASCVSTLQGQCMPNLSPNFTGRARITGGYGRDANGNRTACNIGVGSVDGTPTGTGCSATTTSAKYIDAAAFQSVPNSLAYLGSGAPTFQLLGNAPRTGAYGITGPASTNFDASLKRTFKIREAMNLQIEADCINVANHTIFGGPNVSVGNAAFGTVSGVSNKPRSFQIAGHINF